MSKEFDKLMSAHEESDRYYIDDINEVRERVKEEFENADKFLSYLEKDERAAKAFFDYSGSKPYTFSVIPIRKSDKLYVKKHTATQRPYYHSHSFYEIIFVQSGKCEFFDYPDGERIRIDKGGACICAPESVHALLKAGKKDVILKAVIPCNVYNEITGNICLSEYGKIKIIENVNDKAYEYFVYFVRENGLNSPFARIAEKSWLSLFILELFNVKSARGGNILEKFDEYLKHNIKCATLSGFAKYVGYAPDYVGRVLKNQAGETFKELLTSSRLIKAKMLLKTTDRKIESIAAECGYRNSSGFYKQFTGAYGITPTQYRKTEKW